MITINQKEFAAGRRDPFVLLAQGLGSGCINPMPGTWGTLGGVLVYLLAYFFIPNQLWLAWVLAACVLGIPLCTYAEKYLGGDDPHSVVWDEWCGIWITYLFVPFNLFYLVLGFILFRIIDMQKPWLIRMADEKLPHGYGIMVDDILAGLLVGFILYIVNIVVVMV